MDKGWGLTLENSDQQVGFFGKNPVFGFNLSPRLNNNSKAGLMMFPVMNSSGNEEADAALSPPRGVERRVILGEVDFFSDKKSHGNNYEVMKKENNSLDDDDDDEATEFDVNTGLQLVTANTGSDQSMVDDGMLSSDAENKRAKNELAQLQVELENMNAENQRLKGMLTQVSNNYTSLHMHLVTLMQHQQNSRIDSAQEHEIIDKKSEEKKQEIGGSSSIVPIRQFLDLTPDRQSNSSSEERTISGSNHNKNKRIGRDESPESQGWGPNKAPKIINTPKPVLVDQSTTEATMRKVRVSVRARSEAPMISDGCQWRKYGQKMAKGNPCPRAYYRCTMAVGCPVRKQVQRCAEDRAILITTYEGTHNHPLPPAAMAMVSTTSAAASMLLSGSMPSADGLMNPNFLARTLLPCSNSNMATISASAPFPTVTLDLTQNPLQLIQRPPVPPQFHQIFGQGLLYNQSKFSGLQMSDHESSQTSSQQQQQQHPLSFADNLSAATAAITADPNFTAALAAAISSIIGGSQSHPNNNNNTTNSSPNVNTSSSNKGN